MLILWIFVSLILLCAFVLLVLSRILYPLRKFSTLSALVICAGLVCLYIAQAPLADRTAWASAILWHNSILLGLLIAGALYQLIMTAICRRSAKWDETRYSGAVILSLAAFPWYLYGLITMALASLNP